MNYVKNIENNHRSLVLDWQCSVRFRYKVRSIMYI